MTVTRQLAAGEGGLFDELSLSTFQTWSILLTAATVILDGLDNQMLGLAAPSLLHAWHVQRSALGPIFALGFVGMTFGTLVSGAIGDRSGRRKAILFGVGTFGVATLLTGFAHTMLQIAALKTLAGVGLGGVPGSATAIIAELSPRRWRSVAVTFGVVCVSIGGILAGFLAAAILPPLGWRWLFYCGGGATVVFTIILWLLLVESPGFLIMRPEREPELRRMFLRMGHPMPMRPVRSALVLDGPGAHAPIGLLFRGALLRDTIALCITMLSGMFLIYLMFNWSPTLFSSLGFGAATTSLGLTSFNLGGTIGALVASVAVMRFGSRPTLLFMSLVAMLVCGGLAVLPFAGGANGAELLLGLCALGVFGSAAQSSIFAVGAHAFPTALRARGMGVMGAAGRVGALLSALLGSQLIGGGNLAFFGMLAGVAALNFMGFLAIRNHVPRVIETASGERLAAGRG